MSTVRYRGGWRYLAIVSLLARRSPRDLLTGELIDVEQHFGTAIEGNHLFPRKWCRGHPEVGTEDEINNIANIAAMSGYTNRWIGRDAPEEYLARIERLGVSRDRLAELLRTHLVDDIDLMNSDRFAEFRDRPLKRLDQLAADAVSGAAEYAPGRRASAT